MAIGRCPTQRPDGHTFLRKFWHFQMAVSCLLLGLFTSNLMILQSLVCTLWLCGSMVADPIINRLIPSPSRFENRQCSLECSLGFSRRSWGVKIVWWAQIGYRIHEALQKFNRGEFCDVELGRCQPLAKFRLHVSCSVFFWHCRL